jgi:hypothetical protein
MTISNELHVQTVSSKGTMLSLITRAASSGRYNKLIVLVAYATRLGCDTLIAALKETCKNWVSMDKQWIISLDFGHTQPEALEILAQLPKSSVFIPNANLVLNSKLKPPIRFHPKLYYFQSSSDPNKVAIVSGSCNLTKGGLYSNTEQATITVLHPVRAALTPESIAHLQATQATIENVCLAADPLTKKILDKYRLLWRPSFLPPVEKLPSSTFIAPNPSIDRNKALALSSATNFWVRVTKKVVQNLGPDRPGNQIDMQCGSRVFFGFNVANVPLNTVLGSVTVRFENVDSLQHLRFGNNGMDKITLPPLMAPRTYAKRTLLFHRSPKGYFDLKIGTSQSATEWRQLSVLQNTLYRMKGGREFGVFE